MDKTVQVDVLIKNVKRFVKKCREKNQELLKFNHLYPVEDVKHSNTNTWEHSVFEKYLKQNSSFSSDKSNDSKKVDGYIKFESTVVREIKDLNLEDKLLNSPINETSQELKIEEWVHDKNEESYHFHSNVKSADYGITTTNRITKEDASNERGNELIKINSNSRSTPIKTIEDSISPDKQSSNESGNLSMQTKKNALETLRSEMIEEDLELLRMYNKLEKSSQTLMFAKSRKIGKKKVIPMKQLTKKSSDSQTTKRKKSKKLKKVPILNLKTNKSVSFTEQIRKNSSKNIKMLKRSNSNNGSSQLSVQLSTTSNKPKYMLSKSSSSIKKSSSVSLSKTLSKKGSDRMISFHEGLKNRLQKNSKNNSSFNIGCMYIKNDMSESEWNTYRKYGKTKSSKHFKNLEYDNTLINKKNVSSQFTEFGRTMEESLYRSKSKKRKWADDVMNIINGLLTDYVPKLIARYDSCIYNMNRENILLKKKIRESLDFGDLQYEEIRELKMQVVHLNNKNKKMNDIISTLREKIMNAEELDAKNLEYLDEIMILKNKISFLERVIEENDQTKKGAELKQMRHSVRMMYSDLKNQMKYMKILKKKYKKRNNRKKFCIKNYLQLQEYPTQIQSSDGSIEVPRGSRIFSRCFLDEEILVSKESSSEEFKENNEDEFEAIEEISNQSNKISSETKIDMNTDENIVEEEDLIETKEEPVVVEEKKTETEVVEEKSKFSYAMSNIEMETLLIFDQFFKLLMKEKDENKKKRILKSLPKKMHHFCRYLTEHSDLSKSVDSDSCNEEKTTLENVNENKTQENIIENSIKDEVSKNHSMHYRNLRLEGIEFDKKKYPIVKANFNTNTQKTKLTKEELSSKYLEKIKNCLCNKLTCCPMKLDEYSSSNSSDHVNILLNNMKKEINTKNHRELERNHFLLHFDRNVLPKEYCIEEIRSNGIPIITKPSTRVFENMKMIKSSLGVNINNFNNVQRRSTQCCIQNTKYKPLLVPTNDGLNYRQRFSSMNNLKVSSSNLVHNK